jgi:hypothetical protein
MTPEERRQILREQVLLGAPLATIYQILGTMTVEERQQVFNDPALLRVLEQRALRDAPPAAAPAWNPTQTVCYPLPYTGGMTWCSSY